MSHRTLRIGTRGSDLALWQARYVAGRLGGGTELCIIKTSGDRIQDVALHEVEGIGFFTKEIETALLDGRVDVAVHSYKDLPTETVPELAVVAVPERAPVRDVVVRRQRGADPSERWGLPRGARVGTSSLRRRAHLLSRRPDLEMVDLRGNVPTRFGKVATGELDAVILAEAGLVRLGLDRRAKDDGVVLVPIEVADVCPAPSQGALAIQVRTADDEARARLHALHDPATAAAVEVERRLLARFGGGCHLPLGAYCSVSGPELTLQALVAAPDGSRRIEATRRGTDAGAVVAAVHDDLQRQGATEYL